MIHFVRTGSNVRVSRIFSYEPVGRSCSAEFLFCPRCQTERTIEFRSERNYFAFLKMPIFPVGEANEVSRCTFCKFPFQAAEIRSVQDELRQKTMNQLLQIVAAFLRFFEFEQAGHFTSVAESFQRHGFQLDAERLQQAAEQTGSIGAEPLIWISRQSDLLNAEQRLMLLDVVAALRHPHEREPEYAERLTRFATAIGLGVAETESLVAGYARGRENR